MSAHTPGPWRLHAAAYVNNGCIGISAPDHDFLAQVVVRMEGDDLQSPQLVANARLIAAAPDLLAALQMAQTIISSDSEHTEAAASITDVIAKATGGAA